MDSVPAPLLVVGSIISVQVGAGLARSLFDDLGAPGVTLYRIGLSALLLLVLARPRVTQWSREAWRAVAIFGVVMAGMNSVFYLSLRTVPLGIAVTVEFIGPLTVALVQSRRFLDVLWALLAATGVVLLGVERTAGVPLSGLLLALTAGMFWAAYIFAAASLGKVLPSLDGLAAALAIATCVVLPFGLGRAATVVHEPSLLVSAAGVAVLSSALPYGLEITALRRLPTRVFGILMSLEPAAAALAGFVILDQRLRAVQLLAILLVCAASAAVTASARGKVALPPLE
jgi:inner membrane transporter RhtA